MHEIERHALGDDEVGEVVDAVDDEEEREERATEEERRDQLADDVAVDARGPLATSSRLLYHRPVSRKLCPGARSSRWPGSPASPPPSVAADPSDRLDRFRELAASRLGLAQILDAEPSSRRLSRDLRAARRRDRREPRLRGSVRLARLPAGSARRVRRRLGRRHPAPGRGPAGCSSAPSCSTSARPPTASACTARLPPAAGPADGAVPRGAPEPCTLLPGARRDGAASSWPGRGRRPGGGRGRCASTCCVATATACGWPGRPADLFADGPAGPELERARRRPARPLRAAVSRAGRRAATARPSRRTSIGSAPGGAVVPESPARSTTPGTVSLHAAVEPPAVGARRGRRGDAERARAGPRPSAAGCRPALAFDPACDARETAGGDAVSVAAAADRHPWTLTFRRPGGRWRLTAAGPVLQ